MHSWYSSRDETSGGGWRDRRAGGQHANKDETRGRGRRDRQTETGICRAAGQQGRDKGVVGARRDRQTETGIQEGRQAKDKIRGWGAKGQTDRDGGQSGQQG